MAHTERKNSKYDLHPGDKSRKGLQRQVNKSFRRETRQALRNGAEILPVVSRRVDRLAH